MEIIETFNKKDSREIEAEWMRIYCKNKQGFNTKDYRWHIFSGRGYPSVEADEAESMYSKHNAENYYVMFNNASTIDLVKQKPTDLNYKDVYVFPKNMAWTMAFTHEEGWLGPYFAKHPNYQSLEKENEKYKLKLQQIAHAKSKGWC
jgi:hypothetical protein